MFITVARTRPMSPHHENLSTSMMAPTATPCTAWYLHSLFSRAHSYQPFDQQMEDYFRFGCSFNINASGEALHSVRCPWGGSDEGAPAGSASRYVTDILIPELTELVNSYRPSYLYVHWPLPSWRTRWRFARMKKILVHTRSHSTYKIEIRSNS